MRLEPCGPQSNVFFTFRECLDLLAIDLNRLTHLILQLDIEVKPEGLSGVDLRKIFDSEFASTE